MDIYYLRSPEQRARETVCLVLRIEEIDLAQIAVFSKKQLETLKEVLRVIFDRELDTSVGTKMAVIQQVANWGRKFPA